MTNPVRVKASERQRAYTRKVPTRRSVEERFWKYVDKLTTPNGCWPWTGSKDSHGYGHFWLNDRLVLAQKVAWELVNGPMPKGKQGLHTCDNPPCARPDHVFPGTRKDNMQDMIRKGRKALGEKTNRTPFSTSFVLQLRKEYEEGARQKDLVKKYNLLSGTLNRLLRGARWAHVAKTA